MPKRPPIGYSEIGCRIPKEYFWVIGWGQSSVGIETGSYDAALHMAGIENYNVMLYTSVLPPEAVELRHLPDIHHGSVLEGIIAVQHTDKPRTRITAGVLLAKVYRNADNSYLGGFACEYGGNGSPEEAEANLREAMQQLFARRYKPKLFRHRQVYSLGAERASYQTGLRNKVRIRHSFLRFGFSAHVRKVILRGLKGFVPKLQHESWQPHAFEITPAGSRLAQFM